MVTPEHHLSDIPLSQDAQDFLVSDGPTEFMREYGTHYVAGLQKGLQYSVILTYESNDAEQVRQILANFGSEVGVPI